MVTNSKNYRRGNFTGVEHIYMVVGETGLIVVNGENHKRLRRLATPAFKTSTLKKVMPYIEMCGERLVKLFQTVIRESNKNEKENYTEIFTNDLLNKTTLDIIVLIAFNYDLKESCGFEKKTFGHELREWLQFRIKPSIILPWQKRMNFAIMKLTRYLPSWMFGNFHTGNKVHDLIDNFIETKIAERRSTSNETNSRSLFEFILDGSESANLNRTELHDMIMTFVVAGHETSSVTLTWTLYLLAKHPEHQVKCREEALKMFQEKQNQTIEWDNVKKLTYLNACIHESLRLYPPVPYLNRATLNEDEISGYKIPANQDVLLLITDMQRNPEYWPNPEDFLPERFLESTENLQMDAYMPFGDGAHKCIGYQLALIEVTYLMAIILKNFEFSLDPNIHYREFSMVTMRPKPDLKLRMKMI